MPVEMRAGSQRLGNAYVRQELGGAIVVSLSWKAFGAAIKATANDTISLMKTALSVLLRLHASLARTTNGVAPKQ